MKRTSVLVSLSCVLFVGLGGCDRQPAANTPAVSATAAPAPTPAPAAEPQAAAKPAPPADVPNLSAKARPDAPRELTLDDGEGNEVTLSATEEGGPLRPKKPLAEAVDPATFPVKLDPVNLDLGQIPTGEVGRGVVKLINRGDVAMTLNECKTSCGCTTTRCPKGKAIEPGEEVEVEVTLKGGQTPHKLTKKVTFLFQDGDTEKRLEMDVSGEAVAFVEVDPQYIVPEKLTDGKVIVRSTDGQAFHITSLSPALIETEKLPQEAMAEHVLYIDWARWEELGSPRQVTFNLDHPKSERITSTIRPLKPVKTANPATTDDQSRPAALAALERLIKDGQVAEIIQRLDQNTADLKATDRSGATLLHLAAKHGSKELVDQLITRGADVNATDQGGRTPLMFAAQAKKPEVVQTLLDHKATLDNADMMGTALSWAAGFGDAQSVALLIEAGANVNQAGAQMGWTPLHLASGFGQAESVTHLIKAGAQLEARDTLQGLTALMFAARTGNAASVDKLRILTQAKADMEARDNNGKTALLIAAESSGATVEMIQALIDSGADINAKDNRGANALDLANKRTDVRADAVRERLGQVLKATGPKADPATGG
jgi:ankyrin repeat protein